MIFPNKKLHIHIITEILSYGASFIKHYGALFIRYRINKYIRLF